MSRWFRRQRRSADVGIGQPDAYMEMTTLGRGRRVERKKTGHLAVKAGAAAQAGPRPGEMRRGASREAGRVQ